MPGEREATRAPAMKGRPPSPKSLQAACDRFNARFKVGDEVTVYTGRIGENPIVGAICFQAEVLSGHTPVVWVNGVRGCVSLSHVTAAPRHAEERAIDVQTERG